jgi:hypothetical protein
VASRGGIARFADLSVPHPRRKEIAMTGTPDHAPDDIPDDIPPAARRALDEAAARARARTGATPPVELGGRDGPDPARYGDWEKKGIAIDF